MRLDFHLTLVEVKSIDLMFDTKWNLNLERMEPGITTEQKESQDGSVSIHDARTYCTWYSVGASRLTTWPNVSGYLTFCQNVQPSIVMFCTGTS